MAISYRAIGRNIRKARLKLHLTQEQAAVLAGMSAVHYGRLERGERHASLEQLEHFATLLNIPLEAILHGASDTFTGISSSQASKSVRLFESLCSGCSPDTCMLMLEICRLIANQDKYSSP